MNALVVNCSPVKNGATAYITELITGELARRCDAKSICIGDYDLAFCRGCRTCHTTAACILHDDMPKIIGEFEKADIIACVSPSYWADIPGQFKSFIDRCTPWCNTHEPHASIPAGKRGFAVALRTGANMPECMRIIQSIEHFYGHMEIECAGHIGLCGIENRADAEARRDEILAFCRHI